MTRKRNDSESPLITGNLSSHYDTIQICQNRKGSPLVDSQNNNTKSNPKESSLHLEKQLGLLDGVGVIVGIMIGSGIFISPKGVVQYAHSAGMALVVWAVSGILTVAGALCYAELGTMIPKSGGDYAYISTAFGGLPGFLYLWVALIIIMPTGNAVISLTFAHYIMKPIFADCLEPPDNAVKLVAAIVVCFLTWINCANARAATKIQDVFTVTKVFALLIIILTGFYHLGIGNTQYYENSFENTNWQAGSISIAFYQGLFSFAGWNCLNYVVEELKDPYRNLPRAIMISLPIVTVIYFFVNVAYFAVLTPNEVIASNAVAVTFGDKMLGGFAWIIPVFVACSTFGCLNGAIFASSRLYFVGAREGQLPDALALINVDALTPVPSLIALSFITVIMMLTADVQLLINYTSFAESLFILISVTALLWLRYKKPDMHRPIKLWIGLPILFFIVSIFLVVLPVMNSPVEFGIVIAIILSGVPAYYLFFRKTDSKTSRFTRTITTTVQLLTNGLPED